MGFGIGFAMLNKDDVGIVRALAGRFYWLGLLGPVVTLGCALMAASVFEGAKGRGETFLESDFVSPWIWLKSLPTSTIERRETTVRLNIRNLPSASGSIVRRTQSVGVRFSVFEVRNGWGATDISRTGWVSLDPSYSKKV